MDDLLASYDPFQGSYSDELEFDLPETSEPVYILGKTYSAIYDLEEIKADVKTRFWFTYRKSFPPIAGSGPTLDTGWGCMLRCGQMMFAQALTMQLLGRDWRWTPDGKRNEAYNSILARFLDHKRSVYSVHQIALMGDSEGKRVGEWFGPNTVAQVMKKLVNYDEISKLAVHIAMDNLLIIEEVHKSCKAPTTGFWTPLLLFIPLRLGLTEMNQAYIRALKSCLSLKETAGIIGGKPNHAYYFIGFLENQLLYLDPHKTQTAVQMNFTTQMQIKDIVDATQGIADESFHCNTVHKMDFSLIDPSIALGFYCHTEADFENLCRSLRLYVLDKQPMLFELCEKSPGTWDTPTSSKSRVTVQSDLLVRNSKSQQQQTGTINGESDSDSDYELLG